MDEWMDRQVGGWEDVVKELSSLCTWPGEPTEHGPWAIPSLLPRALVITCGEEAEWSPRGHLGAAHWC